MADLQDDYLARKGWCVISEDSILQSLKTLLPVGTTISPQSVYLRQGITPQTAIWPALMLSIPLADDEQITLGGPGSGAFQTTHVCHCLYLDRWESGSRKYEQIMADANMQVQQMLFNVRSNPSLTVSGVDGCFEIRHIQKRMLGPLDSKELGFPTIQAQLILWIVDFPMQYSP